MLKYPISFPYTCICMYKDIHGSVKNLCLCLIFLMFLQLLLPLALTWTICPYSRHSHREGGIKTHGWHAGRVYILSSPETSLHLGFSAFFQALRNQLTLGFFRHSWTGIQFCFDSCWKISLLLSSWEPLLGILELMSSNSVNHLIWFATLTKSAFTGFWFIIWLLSFLVISPISLSNLYSPLPLSS